VAGWRLEVAARGEGSFGRAVSLLCLVGLPLLATVASLPVEEALNRSNGAWDGRVVPIRLALFVVTPITVVLMAAAVRRSGWAPTLGLAGASAALSYVVPFAVLIALVIGGGGS